ncbi:MAG: hypothetical protein Q9226_002352 [Calogaya cf. arnoldii]
MTELPSEIILMIINYLPRRSRKRMRLVCRTWGALGAEGLIDRVFISPFEVDMKVFDEISRHPIFSKSVKQLVYDAAQFHPHSYSDADYLRWLLEDFYTGYMRYNTVMSDETRDLKRAITSIDSDEYQAQAAFVRGQEQCCHHAEEHVNITTTSWFDRVRIGLNNLLSVETVVMRNSWDMIYDDAPADNEKNGSDFETSWTVQGCANVNKDGRRMVGSPLARSWPPTYLRPGLVQSYNYHDPLHARAVSDGTREFSRLLQLLDSVCMTQRIKGFQVSGDTAAHRGVSPYAFFDAKGADSYFTTLSRNLRVLSLTLTPCTLEPARQPMLDLQILKKALESTQSLEWLSLNLPLAVDDFEVRDVHSLYHLTLVFPQTTAWNLPCLRGLRLRGLRASFDELITLLYLNCPKLQSLDLSYFQLKDGHWEDIIEGLCRLPDFRFCNFFENGLLWSTDDLFNIWADTDERYEDGERDFCDIICRYVSSGGRHPCLARDAPDSASTEYMVRLNERLDNLRLTAS